jgi:phytoene dehydrogenase-like protein
VISGRRDVVVVGAGHNGLVAACYLARAGFDVEVIERDTVVGGAVSTVERWPGVRVDRGSSIHVMVRHTDLVTDLELGQLGLVYDDVDPWAVVPHPDGAIRLSSDLGETCDSIAATCGTADAIAYRRFVEEWTPRTQWFLSAGERPPTLRNLGRSSIRLIRREHGRRRAIARTFLEPADTVIERSFTDERLRAAVAWWAAQSGPPPHAVGTAPIAGTVAMFHQRRAGRPRGGSGRLSETLAARFVSYGGSTRVGDPVTRIDADSGNGCHVTTESGARIATRMVLAACHVAETARLLGDDTARESVRIGAGLGMAVRLLTDALPRYRTEVDGVHTAMQFLVDSTQQVRAAYGDFLRGEPASDPPLIVMTPSATDATLAPVGKHVVTVWAQWHPYRLRDGHWDSRRDEVADTIVAGVERWAPGFRDHIVDRFVQTPLDLERELGLLGGNVMHVESELDAMFTLRPMPGWSGYRTPHSGVYLCGASTHPGGGVWGASGRSAADVVMHDLRKTRR